MSTFAEELRALLSAGRFDELSVSQWEQVILCLIAEEIQGEAAYNHAETPKWTTGVPPVYASIALRLNTRDVSETSAACIRFRHDLSVKARIAFSDALTRVVAGAYETLKQAGYELEQASTILKRGLMMGLYLHGAISSGALSEMAFDPKLSLRGEAAKNLVDRDFSNSAPDEFWRKLEGQLSWSPDLIVAVMARWLSDSRPLDALKALKNVGAQPEKTAVLWHLQDALEKSMRYSNHRVALKEIFKELPPWVLEVIRQHPKIRVFKEVLDLLEEK